MEDIKDFPKEFLTLFKPSFECFSKVNVQFLEKKEVFVKKYWRFFYIIPFILINYVTVGVKLFKLIEEGHYSELAKLLPMFFGLTQVILKTTIITAKKAPLTSIIQDLGRLWKTSNLNEEQKKLRDKLAKRVNLCNKVTLWISFMSGAHYLMSSLVETLVRKYILKQDIGLLLPSDNSYPFNVTENWPVYGSVYAFQTYSTLLYYFAYVGADQLVVTLCAVLGIEFLLLSEDVGNITQNRTKRPEENEELYQEHIITIKDIVPRHQKLCALSRRMNRAFNTLIVIDLVWVGIMICFCRIAAQYSHGPTYSIILYVAAISALLHILYLCYYGQFLTDASLRVGEMAYNTLWYDCHSKHKKDIRIIIMRSQKMCCLTSFNYVPVNCNLFPKVLRYTWSYLSLMNFITKEKT